jgi:hypothetical protein
VGALAGVLALGGAAWATTPDSGGVISGCYTKSSGSLRVIDTGVGQGCDTRKESPLSWNQTGPQGPAGATGPRGPSDAWNVSSGVNDAVRIQPNNTVTVASLSLPAGDFFVEAKTAIGGTGAYTCYLTSGDDTLDISTGGNFVTIPLQSTVQLPSGGTVTLTCSSSSVSDATAFQWRIDAIEVGAVH